MTAADHARVIGKHLGSPVNEKAGDWNQQRTLTKPNISMTKTGKIIVIDDPMTFASGFTKREFVLEIQDGKYPQTVKFELLKERVEQLDKFQLGDEVECHFDIRGREHNGKFWNNLVAWRLERAAEPSSDPGQNYREKAGQAPAQVVDDGDEIPF